MPESEVRHSKAKVALIPVLLCILVAVLYDPDTTPSVEEYPAARTENAPAAKISESDLQRLLKTLKKRQTPEIDFEEVVSYDPFRKLPLLRSLSSPQLTSPSAAAGDVPDAVEAPKPPDSKPQELPETKTFGEIKAILQARSVSAVIKGTAGNAAIIDARIVHVGDLLEPGVRIVGINPQGITVQIEPN